MSQASHSTEQTDLSQSVPCAPDLFAEGRSGLTLVGSRCTECGERFFPSQAGCSSCSATAMEEVELGSDGVLWSWTYQSFMPKVPYRSDETEETFRPYGVGYIEMPCGLKIESRLIGVTPDSLSIGIPMYLTLEKMREDDDGKSVVTFAFEPADEDR